MATLTAAIGCAQMRHWDARLEARRANDHKLGAAVEGIDGFAVAEVPDYVDSPYDRGHIRFDPAVLGGVKRDRWVAALQAEGAGVNSATCKDTRIPHTDLPRALHLHPVFAGNEDGTGELLKEVLGADAAGIAAGPGTLPVTEDMEVPYDTLQLPSFTRPAGELIEQYRTAFEKVATRAGELGGK